MNALVHIAPQLPPAIDGVGDYCWNLWKYWPEPQPHWTFLVARGAAETAIVWREIDAHEFDPGGTSLREALEETGHETVILHYVGYAYHPKGAPVWLPGALEAWKRADSRRRLVTMFHEMYAQSSPLRSPFWVAPFARHIIRQLVGLSDAWVTSCDRYFRQLTTEFGAPASHGRIIPIGSNIPRLRILDAILPEERAIESRRRIAVFGLAKTRLWALGKHRQLLGALAEAGMIEHVTLIGKHPDLRDEKAWQQFAATVKGRIPWRKRFDLSSADVSHELAEHDFGLLANEPDILTKSGVFAALATHGVIPIVSGDGRHVLPPSFDNAALVNEEADKTIAGALQVLRNTMDLRERRERLLALASGQLAWPRITESWNNVLEHVVTPQTTRRRSETTALRPDKREIVTHT